MAASTLEGRKAKDGEGNGSETTNTESMKEEQDCEYCGGTGFDGFDREFPPNPYICARCNSYERNQKNGQPPARQEGETKSNTPIMDAAMSWHDRRDLLSQIGMLEMQLSAKQAELDALTKHHKRTARWLEITSNEKGDLIDAHDAALAELESMKAAQTTLVVQVQSHLNEFAWMDGPEGWSESCQVLRASLPLPTPPVERSENKG